jgi:Fic family protein
VTKAMQELMHDTNERLKNIDEHDINKHPLTIAAGFHQQFLNKIHPFSDGNGRIGRLFTNLILLKEGYPPMFIKDVDRGEYLKRFEQSDTDLVPMLDFLADRLIESLKIKLEFIENHQ